MKKAFIQLFICSTFLFASSPQSLENLVSEHKKVEPTHGKQYQTIINKKELEKYILLAMENKIFELKRLSFLVYNGFLIQSQKEF